MQIPTSGLGTYGGNDPERLKKAIVYAVEECGYRHIDCAAVYGNEKVIGEALQTIFKNGKVKREELWITSKVWNTKHREPLLIAATKNTLKDLQLDYVDLMLVHWPCAFQQREDNNYDPRDANGNLITERVDILETWEGMQKIHDMGLAKHIGVSNFSIEMLERMRYSDRVKIQPYCNQIEGHLYHQQPVMSKYLESRKIYLTMFTCLGRATLNGPFGVPLIQDPVLLEVAKEVGKAPTQVNLQFLKQLSPYHVVIPMSLNPVNIKSNIELDFKLTEEQMNNLRSRDRAFRFIDHFDIWGIDPLNVGH